MSYRYSIEEIVFRALQQISLKAPVVDRWSENEIFNEVDKSVRTVLKNFTEELPPIKKQWVYKELDIIADFMAGHRKVQYFSKITGKPRKIVSKRVENIDKGNTLDPIAELSTYLLDAARYKEVSSRKRDRQSSLVKNIKFEVVESGSRSINNQSSNDEKDFLSHIPEDRRQRIINSHRIALLKQIRDESYESALEECTLPGDEEFLSGFSSTTSSDEINTVIRKLTI